jgi:hypothetical protein
MTNPHVLFPSYKCITVNLCSVEHAVSLNKYNSKFMKFISKNIKLGIVTVWVFKTLGARFISYPSTN